MSEVKKYFKELNKFDICLLSAAVILILGVGTILKCNFLTIICAFIGFFSAFNQGKGKVIGQIIGLAVCVLYSIVSYQNKYYGEVIIYIVIILPLYSIGIYTWMKNKNEQSSRVNQSEISKNEWLIIALTSILLYYLLYLLLKYFNTNSIYISTLSMVINLIATYLLVRRSRYSFLFYIVNAVILFTLWTIPVIDGDIMQIPLVFDALLLFANDIYALKNWIKNK